MLTELTHEDLQNEWRNPYLQWWAAGMPSYETLNLETCKQISIQFKTKEDRQAFAELLNYDLTERTPYIWYPAEVNKQEQNITNGYVDESEI